MAKPPPLRFGRRPREGRTGVGWPFGAPPKSTGSKGSGAGAGPGQIDWGSFFAGLQPKYGPITGPIDWQSGFPPEGMPLIPDPSDPTTWVGYKPPTMEDILREDPWYQAGLADLNAESIADKASRNAAIRSAMIRFGIVPEGDYGFLGGDINEILDPATRAAAQQNTESGLSVWARLKEAAQIDQRDRVNQVGAKGSFRSGETGYQLKQAQELASRNQFDSVNELMDFLSGAQAGFAAAERARLAQLRKLQEEAAGRWKPKYPTPPTTTTAPTAPQATSTNIFGEPIKWVNPRAGRPWAF